MPGAAEAVADAPLCAAALAALLWSSKLVTATAGGGLRYNDPLRSRDGGNGGNGGGSARFGKSALLRHDEAGGAGLRAYLLGSGVCRLGRAGFFPVAALLALATALPRSPAARWLARLAVAAYLVLSLLMNVPLFVRSAPFFALAAFLLL